jgi:hypothetical protein
MLPILTSRIFTRVSHPASRRTGSVSRLVASESFHRTGLWNWDSQPFSDGMFYTGCSRSISAAGLKIYSSLGDLNVNKVDFQLLGVRPRVALNAAPPPPSPPPAAPEPMDTTPPPTDERPAGQPQDAGEPMEVDPQPEIGEDVQQSGEANAPPEGGTPAQRRHST